MEWRKVVTATSRRMTCGEALAQAYADSVPMLLISSANRSESLGKGWGCLHEITDQSAVTAPLAAFSALVRTPEDIPELIAQAFTVFHSRRPRHCERVIHHRWPNGFRTRCGMAPSHGAR